MSTPESDSESEVLLHPRPTGLRRTQRIESDSLSAATTESIVDTENSQDASDAEIVTATVTLAKSGSDGKIQVETAQTANQPEDFTSEPLPVSTSPSPRSTQQHRGTSPSQQSTQQHGGTPPSPRSTQQHGGTPPSPQSTQQHGDTPPSPRSTQPHGGTPPSPWSTQQHGDTHPSPRSTQQHGGTPPSPWSTQQHGGTHPSPWSTQQHGGTPPSPWSSQQHSAQSENEIPAKSSENVTTETSVPVTGGLVSPRLATLRKSTRKLHKAVCDSVPKEGAESQGNSDAASSESDKDSSTTITAEEEEMEREGEEGGGGRETSVSGSQGGEVCGRGITALKSPVKRKSVSSSLKRSRGLSRAQLVRSAQKRRAGYRYRRSGSHVLYESSESSESEAGGRKGEAGGRKGEAGGRKGEVGGQKLRRSKRSTRGNRLYLREDSSTGESSPPPHKRRRIWDFPSIVATPVRKPSSGPGNILGAILSNIPEVDIVPQRGGQMAAALQSDATNMTSGTQLTNFRSQIHSPQSSSSKPAKDKANRPRKLSVSRKRTASADAVSETSSEKSPKYPWSPEFALQNADSEITVPHLQASLSSGPTDGNVVTSGHLRVLMSWEDDMDLGAGARKAPVLYALESIPEEVAAVGGPWMKKARYIWNRWKRLHPKERDGYIVRAKANRRSWGQGHVRKKLSKPSSCSPLKPNTPPNPPASTKDLEDGVTTTAIPLNQSPHFDGENGVGVEQSQRTQAMQHVPQETQLGVQNGIAISSPNFVQPISFQPNVGVQEAVASNEGKDDLCSAVYKEIESLAETLAKPPDTVSQSEFPNPVYSPSSRSIQSASSSVSDLRVPMVSPPQLQTSLLPQAPLVCTSKQLHILQSIPQNSIDGGVTSPGRIGSQVTGLTPQIGGNVVGLTPQIGGNVAGLTSPFVFSVTQYAIPNPFTGFLMSPGVPSAISPAVFSPPFLAPSQSAVHNAQSVSALHSANDTTPQDCKKSEDGNNSSKPKKQGKVDPTSPSKVDSAPYPTESTGKAANTPATSCRAESPTISSKLRLIKEDSPKAAGSGVLTDLRSKIYSAKRPPHSFPSSTISYFPTSISPPAMPVHTAESQASPSLTCSHSTTLKKSSKKNAHLRSKTVSAGIAEARIHTPSLYNDSFSPAGSTNRQKGKTLQTLSDTKSPSKAFPSRSRGSAPIFSILQSQTASWVPPRLPESVSLSLTPVSAAPINSTKSSNSSPGSNQAQATPILSSSSRAHDPGDFSIAVLPQSSAMVSVSNKPSTFAFPNPSLFIPHKLKSETTHLPLIATSAPVSIASAKQQKKSAKRSLLSSSSLQKQSSLFSQAPDSDLESVSNIFAVLSSIPSLAATNILTPTCFPAATIPQMPKQSRSLTTSVESTIPHIPSQASSTVASVHQSTTKTKQNTAFITSKPAIHNESPSMVTYTSTPGNRDHKMNVLKRVQELNLEAKRTRQGSGRQMQDAERDAKGNPFGKLSDSDKSKENPTTSTKSQKKSRKRSRSSVGSPETVPPPVILREGLLNRVGTEVYSLFPASETNPKSFESLKPLIASPTELLMENYHPSGFSAGRSPKQENSHPSGFSAGRSPKQKNSHTSGFSTGRSPKQENSHTSGFSTGRNPKQENSHQAGFSAGCSPKQENSHPSGFSPGCSPKQENSHTSGFSTDRSPKQENSHQDGRSPKQENSHTSGFSTGHSPKQENSHQDGRSPKQENSHRAGRSPKQESPASPQTTEPCELAGVEGTNLEFLSSLSRMEVEQLYLHNMALLERQKKVTKILEKQLIKMEQGCSSQRPSKIEVYRRFLNFVVEPSSQPGVSSTLLGFSEHTACEELDFSSPSGKPVLRECYDIYGSQSGKKAQ